VKAPRSIEHKDAGSRAPERRRAMVLHPHRSARPGADGAARRLGAHCHWDIVRGGYQAEPNGDETGRTKCRAMTIPSATHC
jgi:hypothetical protein